MTVLYTAIYRVALVTAVIDRVPFTPGLVLHQNFHDSKGPEKEMFPWLKIPVR